MESKHPTYTVVKDASEADACGWGFYSNDIDKMTKIYFKFPPLGDEDLRIDIHYAGLCYSEVHTVSGDWGPRPTEPIIPGHEIVGVVKLVGKNVKDFKEGDRVGFGCYRDFCGKCKKCTNGQDNFCQGGIQQHFTYGGPNLFWGGYATALQNPAKLFFKLPEGTKDELAAPLFCAGVTTYNPCEKYCKKGDEVAVLGIGGLGHMSIQYAKKWGCKVTAFTSTAGKEDQLKGFGADRVVVTTEKDAVKKEAGKFDVVMNTLPHSSQEFFDEYFALLDNQGTWVQLGAPHVGTSVKFYLGSVVFTEKKIVGSQVGAKKVVQDMLDFSVKNSIYPTCEQFGFEDFPKAWHKLAHGKPHFRCVVKCQGGFK